MLLVACLERKSAKSFRTELSILSQKVENKEEEYNVENEENRVENKEDEEEVENEENRVENEEENVENKKIPKQQLNAMH